MTKVNIRAILVLVLIIVIIAFLIFVNISSHQKKKALNEAESSKVFAEDYLVDNCFCVERDRFACGFDGFVFKNGFCWNGTIATNPTKKCSKYKCSEDIVNFNGTDWEIQQN